ncbi:OmpA family protein [Ralstonia sp. 1138]|uniref:OmpA family protein n=1 Tax=Ralstonia sp. 1138 TaxID=3156423 RepID=UPI0033910262
MPAINIIRSLEQLFGDTLVAQPPQVLGETKTVLRGAMDFLLPNLVGAVATKGSTPEGAAHLHKIISDHAQELNAIPLQPDVSSMTTETSTRITSIGATLFANIFERDPTGVAELVAAKSGAHLASAVSLVRLVMPYICSEMRRAAVADAVFTPALLGPFLRTQKNFISPQLVPHFFSKLGLGDPLGGLGHSYIPPTHSTSNGNAAGQKSAAAPSKTTETSKSSWLWLLPLLLALLLLVVLLSYCSKQSSGDQQPHAVTVPAPAAQADASAPTVQVPASAPAAVVDASAPQIPAGSGNVSEVADGRPVLKAYFDYGKAELGADFSEKAKDLVTYLKTNVDKSVAVSGFTDASGDKTLNEVLAKKRAEAVQTALMAAGVPEGRIVLQKTADATEAPATQQGRRVEIRILP